LAPRQKEHLQGLLRLNEAELAKLNSIGVPSLPANFLPRSEDLEVIKRALMVEECKTTAITGASSIGLHGMGGIGKSVLAAAVARDEEIRRHFPDGILWLNIGTGPKITRRQSDLAGMLDGKPHLFEDSIQGQTVLSILLADKACLIVLDDVWHAGDVWVLLSDVGPGNRILITTRDASIITALGGREYTLELLSDTQSRELLARCSGTAVDVFPTEADEIIRQCGNLPLALALCGAQVRDGVPWVDLLDALKDADLQFIDHEQGSGMKSMKVSVNNLSPRDAKCYGELAFIPPDEAIPEEAILPCGLILMT
jgi:hypothetical protein